MGLFHYCCAVLLAVNIYISGSRAFDEDLYNPDESNIVGGFFAKPGQFPHQVSLRYVYGGRNIHFCGGSILDKWHVVTAGHCARIMTTLEYFNVVYGTINLNDTTAQRKTIANITSHPLFSMQTIKNDIALIKLKSPIKYNKHVKPIKLNTRWIKKGTQCVTSGWGRWSLYDPVRHSELKGAKLPFVDVKECARNYSGASWAVDPKTMVCAGHPNGGDNVCKGDSGGPLVCKGKLVGIVSWGRGCAMQGYPAVYTRVQTYVRWLKKQGVRLMDNAEENDDTQADVEFEDNGENNKLNESDEKFDNLEAEEMEDKEDDKINQWDMKNDLLEALFKS